MQHLYTLLPCQELEKNQSGKEILVAPRDPESPWPREGETPLRLLSVRVEGGTWERKAGGIWEGRKGLEGHGAVGVSCCKPEFGDQGWPSSCKFLQPRLGVSALAWEWGARVSARWRWAEGDGKNGLSRSQAGLCVCGKRGAWGQLL